MCEKKKNIMKNETKNGAENELGYCPTVPQYNKKLHCDTASCLGVQKGCWVCHNTKVVS